MRSIAKAVILGCFMLCCLMSAANACEEPLIPELPNPDLAGEMEMLRAQVEVRQYILKQEAFLDCIQRNTRKHNRALEVLLDVANKYNSAARRYNMRMQAKNMFTELALLDVSRF